MATPTKDALLVSAVELARQAAIEAAENPAHVGEHLGVVVEGERLLSHQFASNAPGYRGWHWTVTLARVPRGRVATICESELLPGDDAILAREWLPWSERLRPGDIGPGDVLPFMPGDPRLEAGYVPTGDDEQDGVAIQDLALARVRVLSREGRDRAAERWYAGSQGPTAPGALAASAACLTCAFIVPLQGPLGQVFGVCSNEWSPDDGKVVSFDHGCGAHSETDLEPHASDWPDPVAKIDDLDLELVSLVEERPAAIQDEPDAVEAAVEAVVDAAVVLAVVEASVVESAVVESSGVEAAAVETAAVESAGVEPEVTDLGERVDVGDPQDAVEHAQPEDAVEPASPQDADEQALPEDAVEAASAQDAVEHASPEDEADPDETHFPPES